MTTPKCFDSATQYEEWRRWAQLAQVNPRADLKLNPAGDTRPNFCQDCTACFKRKMMEAGRCEYPQTEFVRVPEPEAGKLERGHEIIGYDGTCYPPKAGDYLLSKVRRGAEVPVSRPASSRMRPARAGSPPPSPGLPGPSAARILADEAQHRAEVVAQVEGLDTGPGPSQS